VEAAVAVTRIRKFLLSEELQADARIVDLREVAEGDTVRCTDLPLDELPYSSILKSIGLGGKGSGLQVVENSRSPYLGANRLDCAQR
jgi:hypothetical protein